MPKRKSSLANSLRQLGEIQVNDWDFMALLNKDISEIDVGHSLRRLGNTQVVDWDFRTVLPAMNKLAQQEIDVVGLVKRAALYKVLEWDFKTTSPALDTKSAAVSPGHTEFRELATQLENFLRYVVVNLTDEPQHARIHLEIVESNVFRFRVVLDNRDVALLIGREGNTVSAIRSILKAAARKHGVHVLLEICPHEVDAGK